MANKLDVKLKLKRRISVGEAAGECRGRSLAGTCKDPDSTPSPTNENKSKHVNVFEN